MDLDELQKKLLAAGRGISPSDQVPYAFEKRILARLRGLEREDPWAWWARAFWRGAGACVAISLLLSAWSFVPRDEPELATDLAEVYGSTVYAAVEQVTDSW